MAQEQNQNEDLKAFEAALAALTPRADRLDRERLMFLAGQAMAEARQGQPGRQTSCTVADGTPTGPAAPRRWPWPAAFAAMTAVAASLLVAILIRPAQVVERVVERIVEVPAPQAVAGLVHEDGNAPKEGNAGETPLGDSLSPSPRRFVQQPSTWTTFLWALGAADSYSPPLPAEAASYTRLRDFDFTQGPDVWPAPAATPPGGNGRSLPSGPVSQRELLKELMKKDDARRPERPGVSPQSLPYPGARS